MFTEYQLFEVSKVEKKGEQGIDDVRVIASIVESQCSRPISSKR